MHKLGLIVEEKSLDGAVRKNRRVVDVDEL
jgi:hypothetical protein